MLQEKKENVVEFNDNMNINVNNQNIGNNLNINISMNVENMTFLKNNMTQKEELLTQFSRKELEKDCLF